MWTEIIKLATMDRLQNFRGAVKTMSCVDVLPMISQIVSPLMLTLSLSNLVGLDHY